MKHVRPDPVFLERRAGVLLPLASLPGGHGVGDLGPAASELLDWLARAGFRWWQMLPVGPFGPGGSPYSSPSSFAGEPLYLSLELLAADGLLEPDELPASARARRVDLGLAERTKRPLFERAWRRWHERGGGRKADWRDFCRANAEWLEPWVTRGAGEAELERFLQFQFARQWSDLRARAAERGVLLLGDLPIFCEADSADVAAHPELFLLDAEGRPRFLTGVPPDSFSETGQLWGHAHYAWPEHRAEGFGWWRRRVAAQLERFDAVRIDHFIGLVRAWRVPAGAQTAEEGSWVKAPGAALLTALAQERGSLPLVAEDLGAATPEVHRLRDRFGLPGMRVLQWGFGGGTYDRPHNHPPHSVVYPGTHDNDTCTGWWEQQDEATRARAIAYGADPEQIARSLARLCFTSPARTAIVQLQDLLGLGSEARTNVPGTANDNWRWRVGRRALDTKLARELRAQLEASERLD